MHLALFDFDGTISNRDTSSDFIVYACGKRRALNGLMRLSPIFLAYSFKRISHHETKQASINHYFGDWDKKSFIEMARCYARRIREKYALKSLTCIYAYGDSPGDREMLALADKMYYKLFD